MHSRTRMALVMVLALVVAACSSPGVSAPAATPTPAATTPSPTAGAVSVPPTPSPVETPEPDPASMDLVTTGCPGGTVLEWTPSTHANFHHYTALRSPSDEIAPDFPPIAPAVDWGKTYTTDPFVTSAVDASVLPSSTEWNYRVMAYDILNDVVSTSPVRSAVIGQVLELGDLAAASDGDATELSWPAYEGPTNCISTYRLMVGVGRPPHEVLSDQSTTSVRTDALHAGTTYQLRVDAVRVTPLGSFVTAHSETLVYTVP